MFDWQLPPDPVALLADEPDDLVNLDLFADISLEGVTSGSNSTAWDPIEIDPQDKPKDDQGVVDTDLGTAGQPGGVTSGNDVIDGDVKTSQRKIGPRH